MTARLAKGQLFNEILAASRAAVALIEEELDREGVDKELYWLLARINHLEPISPTGLVTVSGVRRTTLRDALERLVARGEVERLGNPDDQRSNLVRLTEKGRERLHQGGPATRRAVRRLEAELEEPYDDVHRSLAALRAAGQRALSRGQA